jgi:4-azaleucine resistance transporter AzlC
MMKRNEFSAGLKAGLSIAIGYFPIALTFGLLAKTTGLSIIEATAMSILVYAGAAQYISLSLIAKSVDPVLIVLNTFVVNIRHFLMTASLNEKLLPSSRWKKALLAFWITDESFSVLATRKEEKLTMAFSFGVALIAYGSWVSFTALGHLIGANLPMFLQAAMSVALYAMFIGLLVPSMRGNRKVVVLAVTAAAINGFFYWTGYLSTGWAILVSTLGASILVEVIYSMKGREQTIPAQKGAES